MKLTIIGSKLVPIKDIKVGQVFKIQTSAGWKAGFYFVKIKVNTGISMHADIECLSLSDFNTHPFSNDTMVYPIDDVEIIIRENKENDETDRNVQDN